jgi:integrase
VHSWRVSARRGTKQGDPGREGRGNDHHQERNKKGPGRVPTWYTRAGECTMSGKRDFVRVGGAELHGRGWRVVGIKADGSRKHVKFTFEEYGERAEESAKRFVLDFRTEATDRSIGEGVRDHIEYLARYGGIKRRPLKVSSLKTRLSLLEGLFQLVDPRLRAANRGKRRPTDLPMTDRPLKSLTPKECHRLYLAMVNGVKSNGKPISADTHRSALIAGFAFGRWCVEQGWLKENPFEGVLPQGDLSRGKAQLNLDEAKRFIRAAYADGHPMGGLAAAAILTLGCRSNELMDRRVRDLDDSGRVLWIPFGKTEASKRRLAVPPVLRSALVKLAEGQGPDAYLFGSMTDGTLLKHVHRLCEIAGVPEVCTHGLRGTQISLTIEVGSLVEAASRGAGHADTGVTRNHYMAAGVEQSARAKVMEELLLRDRSAEQEAAELAEAEREMAQAAAKLASLRAARTVTLSVGTTDKPAYPGPTKRDVTN